MVAFPEMAVPGYIVGDLWEVDALVRDWDTFSERLRDPLEIELGEFEGTPAPWRSSVLHTGRLGSLSVWPNT